jgi:hypothetical protein
MIGIQKPNWHQKSLSTDFIKNHKTEKTGRFLLQNSIFEIWGEN